MKSQRTRARLLEAGLHSLSAAGLPGVTVGRLADAVGLSKSGMFAHFGSKTCLEIALLDEAARVATEHVVEPVQAWPEGLPRLRALLTNWLGWSTRAGLPGGCPFAAALFELDDLEGEVRDHAAALELHWRNLLRSLVVRGIELEQVRPDADADQIVWELCGIYLSHHASVRFQRDPAADDRAWAAIEALLGRYGADASNSP